MPLPNWLQIKEIFLDAIEFAPGERAAFLDEKCGDDLELRSEIEKLIGDDEEAENLMSRPLMDDSGIHVFAAMIDEDDPLIGKIIGAYRLEKQIGRGGMGTVYLAERADGSFRQQVAVKLIKRGMDTDFILRRFRQERQILASLNHPLIARLLDGGTTADDLPFFVMEFIAGKPLYKFSDEKKLTIAERLKLFRHICEAVDYAHQNRVIHRDIKPPNILVTENGTPKLLDFGIAKVLNPDLSIDTIDPTATAMRLMTPEYASPEQVCGLPVTPASDIYSLGVLLYELLTGHRPYHFQNRAPHEIARVICEEEPLRPSTGITREDNLLPTGASEATTLVDVYLLRGAANIEDLQREISGDLEKIILKCLRKEPGERYQTAHALAEDISRYLEGKPVAAESYFPAPVETTIERNSVKSLAVLPLKILNLTAKTDSDENFLSIGLADAMISRLSGIKSLAVRPTSTVLRYGGENVNPLQAGKELAVDLVLDGRLKIAKERIRVSLQLLDVKTATSVWANQFDENFADALELEDKISEKVSEVLLPELTASEKKQIKKRGTENAEAFDAYLRGRFFWNKFTPEFLPRAFEAFQRAIELDPAYAMAHASLADFYNWAGIYGVISSEEGHSKAKAAALRALEIDDELAEAIAAYALAISSADWNRTEAERLYQKAIELHPNYSLAHEWYAALMVGEGRFEEGVKMVRQAEKLNPLSLRAMTLSAWTFYQAGLFPEAIAKAEQIINLDKNFPQGYVQLGNALMHVGRTAEAIAAVEQADKMMPNTALTKYLLCFALVADNRREDARKVLEEIETLAAERYVKPFFLGMGYAALGERDRSFEFFGKAFDEHDQWLNWFGTETKLGPLRDDSRFQELFRRTNNPLAGKSPGEENSSGKQPPAGIEKSIAVLPLKFISAASETDDQYLSVGLADAMITRLSKVGRLIVRPTSSVLRFGDFDDAFLAGKELGVDFVLCGMIRRAGERVRISAQLLDIETNVTRWAEKFNESLTDVLELEDTVAEKVGRLLIPQLTGEERQNLARRGTNNPQAFEAYLRGRYHLYLLTPDEFVKAKTYFEQAIALDPNYALAFNGLADYYFALATFAAEKPLECYKQAGEMAKRALAIDETLGEAYVTLGFAHLAEYDFGKIEENIRHSIKLSPSNPLGRVWLSVLLTWQGKYDEAVDEANYAAELNPLAAFEQQHLAWILYQARRFEEAAAKARRTTEDTPNFSHGLGVLSWILRQRGQMEESIVHAENAVRLSGENPWLVCNLAASYAAAGEVEKVSGILPKLEILSATQFVSPYCLAVVYCALGDTERTFTELEKAFQMRDVWMLWLASEPQFDCLRTDERYRRLLRLMKDPQAESKNIATKTPNADSEKSIAVLPFKLLGAAQSNDTGDDYLSIGLADTIITRLSNVRRFFVRPTSSVLRYDKNNTDAFTAGRELDVDFVVNGNLRRIGGRIRVSAQLLSMQENSTIWAQSFDEDAADVLALEDLISEQIAKSLLPHLTGEDERRLKKRGTDNAAAFEAYLRGRHHWNTFTEEGFAKALIFYNQAIAAAPDYALAYAGIADYYNFLGIYAIMPMPETSAAAKEAALDAIAADPNLAEGYAALGFAVLMHDFDWTETERHFRRAVELNPNYVTGRVWYSYFLGLSGRFDEALEQIGAALKIDRLTPIVPQTYNWILYYSRRYDQAIETTRRFIKDEPRYGLTFLFFASMLWRVGYHDEALKIGLRAVELLGRTPYTLVWLASAYAAKGETAEAEKLLAEIEELSAHRYASPYLIAMVYANLKNTERTIELLEKAWEIRDSRMLWLGVDPQFDEFRENPRVQEILKLTNNPAVLIT